MEWRKAITVVIAALAVAGAVRADMVPLSASDAAVAPSSQADPVQTDLPALADHLGVTGFDFGTIGVVPEGQTDAGQTPPQSVTVLSDRQNSLHLCLYALMGLGLCKSGPYVRKFSLGAIPEWYHTGGPFQVGHSHAIAPDCFCQAPIYCFIQPDSTAEDHRSRCRQETIVALWRKSQFTPEILASRAPPHM